MSNGRDEHQITIRTVSGQPTLAAADAIEREMRLEAGVSARPLLSERWSPTVFHVAMSDAGEPLGVASTSVGDLAELPVGLALIAAGVTVTDLLPLPGPVCELVSIAVDTHAEIDGVSELLYRAFYRRARSASARSVALMIDPWLGDVMRDEYGVAFRTIGPAVTHMGRQLLPVGEELDVLEASVLAADPTFHSFLTAVGRN